MLPYTDGLQVILALPLDALCIACGFTASADCSSGDCSYLSA
jgi:hypothetical protein